MHSIPSLLEKAAIAVVRTDRLGDMVLTLPLCQAIKTEFPSSKLSLIARSYVRPLLENSPAIDEVHYIDEYQAGINEIFSTQKFDAAFFPRPRYEEAMAAFSDKVPLRVGSGYRLYSLLFNHRIWEHRKKGTFHEAEYNVHLLSKSLGRELETKLVKPYVNPESDLGVKSILATCGLKGGSYIILHPGSGGSSRDWKPQYFAELAQLISNGTNYRIIVTGLASESESCKLIANNSAGVFDLSGKLDLSGMIALTAGAKLLVANSTGMLHVAAALGVPVVGLFPNTSEISGRRWGPYSKNSAIVSPPVDNKDEWDDMSLISPEKVYEAAISLLQD